MTKKITPYSLFFVVLALFLLIPGEVLATENENAFRSTDYPLPRFVSLNADKIYVRTGPGQRYPIKWVFKKKGLPVEIVLEYDVWRKIKDRDGEVGWIHKSLLSGRRTGIIQGKKRIQVHQKPKPDSRLVAYVEPGVVGGLRKCETSWCEFEAAGYKGWVEREAIWAFIRKNQLTSPVRAIG